ncbi:hypothetical protein [Lonepinella sp. BR2271]|uniref:hypothetical protein n=1 Tax=Lonepinella sp. BR2271 TaxID=3434550 RepID=UPI003F6DD04A
MKVLHAALMKHAYSGILNQMTWEKQVAIKQNLDWDVVLYVNQCESKFLPSDIIHVWDGSHRTVDSICSWISIRRDYYKWLLEQSYKYDLLLVRHSFVDPFQSLFLKQVKVPVYLVHHTLEVPEIKLMSKGLKSILKTNMESFFGKISINNAQGVIAVTNEIFEYENNRVGQKFKNKIIYPNGISYNDVNLVDNRADSVPELLFVASYFNPWHGLDLLLNDLKNTSEKFILHIVGNLSQADKLIAQQDSRIVLHGHLPSSEIQRLVSQCWIGLSSFALFRQDMQEACTLKVREYLKNGLPVYSGHKDIFPQDFNYYKVGKPDFESILEYARNVRDVERNRISESAMPYIEKELLLKCLYSTLEHIVV